MRADHSAVALARADGARGVCSMRVIRAGVERIVSRHLEIPAVPSSHSRFRHCRCRRPGFRLIGQMAFSDPDG